MGLFNRKNRELRAVDGEVIMDDPLLRAMLGGGTVTKAMALQVPTVSGGIDMIASLIASTPLKLYREQDGKTQEITDDPRVRLLNDETGDTLDANQFWRAMVRDYYTGKGGYAYINRKKGRFVSIHYVDEAYVSINKNEDPIFKDYSICVNGATYRPFDFLKLLRNTKDGAAGTPITEENSKLIEVAYQSLCFEAYQVKKGGNKKGFLKSEKSLTQQAMDKLKAAFANLYSNNSDNVVILNSGIDFKESSSTSVEMQINESKITNASEFAKIFHISADTIGGSGSEQDMAAVAKIAAVPLMVTIQNALNRDFLLEREKGQLYWAFDTKQLLKGDLKSRYEAYKLALDANFMQPDEVRYEEDMEPLGLNWIRLGLQDVLYDPETKLIYTPNTNKTVAMGSQPMQKGLPVPEIGPNSGPTEETEEPEESEIRARWIKKPDGKFNGSVSEGGGTVDLPDGKWKKRAYNPSDYSNLTVGSKNNKKRTEVGPFEGKGKRDDHIERHKKEVGAKSEREYCNMAVEFLSKPLGANMEDLHLDNGKRYRYDYSTNEYGVVNSRGNVSTYYKPREKEKAWEEEVKKFGKRN